MDKEEVSQLVGPAGQDEAVGEWGERMGLEGQSQSSRVLSGLVHLCFWWAADPGS